MIKKTSVKFVLGILVMFLLSVNVWGLVFANESDNSIAPPGDDVSVLRTRIIEGANCFLKSYSSMLTFLAGIEMSELEGADTQLLLSHLENAAGQLGKTRLNYLAITREADSAPYNQEVIAKLSGFNYLSFQKGKALNRSVFNRVRHYLEKGDVRGLYHKLLADVEDILNRLETLRVQVAAGRLPDIEAAWRANQAYMETLLFGQYIAEIFTNIKSK